MSVRLLFYFLIIRNRATKIIHT